MATIEEALYAELTSVSEVTALVATRIYPLLIPDDASIPAVAYQRITGPRHSTHSGPSGLAFARMQFTVAGDTYASAKAVAEAIRHALDGFSGTAGGVMVYSSFLDDERDEWSTDFEAPMIEMDFIMWYEEE